MGDAPATADAAANDVVAELPLMYRRIALLDKVRRLQSKEILVPLPPEREAIAPYTFDYAGDFKKREYAPGQRWSTWRKPSKDGGSAPPGEFPKAPDLFGVGGAAVPHPDPESCIVPSEEQASEALQQKKEAKVAEKLNHNGMNADQVRQAKELAAKTAKDAAALRALVKSHEDQLRGVAVRIARRSLAYTYGMAIAEPTDEQMAAVNEKIKVIMPSAPQITAAQGECWFFHSTALHETDTRY